MFWHSFYVCEDWTWVSYMSNVLLIKTIFFDILDFWCQLVVIRFVKTLSKRRMFVSFIKISACWLLHRLIKFKKIVEKRDLPNHGQTCGHRFADVIWRIPNPTLDRFHLIIPEIGILSFGNQVWEFLLPFNHLYQAWTSWSSGRYISTFRFPKDHGSKHPR